MTKWDYDKLNAEEEAALLPVLTVRGNGGLFHEDHKPPRPDIEYEGSKRLG